MRGKPKLIGGKTCARSTVRQQMVLVLLDHKFHSSPAGVDRLLDEPIVQPKGVIFDFENDSACLRPGVGFVKGLYEHFNRMFFLLESLRGLFNKRLDLSDQRGEGLRTQNIFHVIVFEKIEDHRTGVIRICPQNDAHLRPGMSDFFNHLLEDGDDLLARRPLSMPKHCCYQFAAFSFINVDGHIAVVAVIGIEKSQLLTTASQIIRLIDIQDDALWGFVIRLDKHIDKHLCDPINGGKQDAVLKATYVRLTGQPLLIIGEVSHRLFSQSDLPEAHCCYFHPHNRRQSGKPAA
jgi:hypothetical protein